MSDIIGAFTIEQIITWRAQQDLDDFARSHGYDDIKSLVTYAGDADATFAAEGARGKLLRSQMWTALRQLKEDVLAGLRTMPDSYEELQTDGTLPALTWS